MAYPFERGNAPKKVKPTLTNMRKIIRSETRRKKEWTMNKNTIRSEAKRERN